MKELPKRKEIYGTCGFSLQGSWQFKKDDWEEVYFN
jgi:hypothetical protein